MHVRLLRHFSNAAIMLFLNNTTPRSILGVSFSASEATLIAGGNGSFGLWNLESKTLREIDTHTTDRMYGLQMDPAGRWAYVSDHRGGFRVLGWDQRETQPAPGSQHHRHVTSFGISSDGTRLVMGRDGAGRRVECWRVVQGNSFAAQPEWSLQDGVQIDPNTPYYLASKAQWGSHVAISPDGSLLVTGESRDGGTGERPLIVTRHAISGELIAEYGKSMTSFDTRLAVAQDNRTAFAWDNRVIERWDLQTGEWSHRIKAPGRSYFYGLAVHPSGEYLISVAGDGQARFINISDLALINAVTIPIGKLHCIAINATGKLAAAGGDRGQIAIWELEV